MARRNLLLYLILLLSTHLAFAQTSTQTLPPTITTVRFTGTSTFMFPTAPATETVFAQTMTFASKVTGGIQASEISVGAGYTISNFSANQYAACWFPVSGTWSFIPRVLFYATMLFALFARTHPWLVAGALASALTYSSVAAVQICLQVWRHEVRGELDLFPILGILSTSCIIVTPLMTWSSTIRYLGLSEVEIQARQANSGLTPLGHKPRSQGKKLDKAAPTRAVLFAWGLVALAGLASALAGLIDIRDYGNYTSLFIYPATDSVRCVPDNGYLNMTAGQYTSWDYFWFDEEFMSTNNCENPCTTLPEGTRTLFRSPTDLKILTAKNIDDAFEVKQQSKQEKDASTFIKFYYAILVSALPFSIYTTLLHVVLFRQYTPHQARYIIYMNMVKVGIPKTIAFSVALIVYFSMVMVLVTTPISFVTNLSATEYYLSTLPQSEYHTAVGQWGVMISTAFVLIALLICRYERDVGHYLHRAKDYTKKGDMEAGKAEMEEHTHQMQVREASYAPDKGYFATLLYSIQTAPSKAFKSFSSLMKQFWDLVKYERTSTLQFLRDPNIEPMSRQQQSKATEPPLPTAVNQATSNISDPQPMSDKDTERSYSAHTPSVANNITNRTDSSIALADRSTSGQEISATGLPT